MTLRAANSVIQITKTHDLQQSKQTSGNEKRDLLRFFSTLLDSCEFANQPDFADAYEDDIPLSELYEYRGKKLYRLDRKGSNG